MKKSMIGMQIGYAFSKIIVRCPHPRGTLPLRSPSTNPPTGLPSPCRSALDVDVSFTTSVDIVSMHNLFLQDVVNGMAYVHVMCVIHT